MGVRMGRGGGLLLFGYVCLGRPLIGRFFFLKSVKLLEIRRILIVFPSEAQSTYKIVSNCLILLGNFWLVLTAIFFFYFFNNQEISQTPYKSFGFWWFFPSKALSTRLYNSVLIIWIGSIFASSNTENFFLRQSLRPKKSHFWRKLTKSSDF